MFSIKNIDLSYDRHVIFRRFDLRILPGEFLCLYGPSGVGKTTILNLLAGLIAPDSGGVDVPRRKTAYVFQEPRLVPWCDVRANLEMGLHALDLSRPERDKTVRALLERLRLEEFVHYFPAQLSGGMKQRVALGRAFAVRPELLLLDEPFVALDGILKDALRDLLLELISWQPCTTVLVTHDAGEAARLGDRIVILAGRPCAVAAEISAPPGPKPRDRHHIQAVKTSINHAMNLEKKGS